MSPIALRQEYGFKSSPYSSHSLLMGLFPAEGRGLSVLDVGCWDGMLSVRLASRGYRVTGIERERLPDSMFPENGRLIQANLHDGIPEINERFDYILCADVLEHLLDPELVLRHLKALLRPGGVIIASLPNSGNLYFRLVVLSGRFPREVKGLFDRTHLHFFTLAGWKELFASAGLTVECKECTGMPFSVALSTDSGWVTAMEACSYGVARLWKTLFAYQFLVKAQDAGKTQSHSSDASL